MPLNSRLPWPTVVSNSSPNFRRIVEHAMEAICVTDSAFNIVYANQACDELLVDRVTGQSLATYWCDKNHIQLEDIIDWAQVFGRYASMRVKGFRKIIDAYPNAKVIETLTADWDREKAYLATHRLLASYHQGELDVIWAASGEMALGASKAIWEAHRENDVSVFSNDVTPELLNAILSNKIQATTYHGSVDWGKHALKYATMLALGQVIPKRLDIKPSTVTETNAEKFVSSILDTMDWETIKGDTPIPHCIKIGWIQEATTGLFEAITRYFEILSADAHSHAITIDIVTHILQDPGNMETKAQYIADLINQDVNAIVLSGITSDIVKERVKQAQDAGIGVIVVNQIETIEDIDVACQLGYNNFDAGMVSGISVIDYLATKTNFIRQQSVGAPQSQTLQQWQAAYERINPDEVDIQGQIAIIQGFTLDWHGELWLKRLSGQRIPTESAIIPMYDDSGYFDGVIVTSRDISERLKYEHSLTESEKIYKTLSELPTDHAFTETLDKETGKYTYKTLTGKHISGNTDQELNEHGPAIFCHPDDLPRLLDNIEASYRGEAREDVYRIYTKDNELKWVTVNRYPEYDDDCKCVVRCYGVASDITERKKAELALQASEARLRQAIQVGNIGIFEEDHITGEIYWSEEQRGIWGIDATSRITLEVIDKLIHPDDLSRVIATALESYEPTSKGIFGIEHRIIKPNGDVRWIAVQSRTLFSEIDNQLRKVKSIGATLDITEHRHIEEAVRRLNTELEQRVRLRTQELELANRELESFSYSVSHDLRAPLRSIDGFSQALVEDYEGVLDVQGQDYLRRIRSASQRMGRLISDLLKFSRVTTQEIRRERTNLSALAHEIALELSQANPERHVEFDIAEDIEALCDPNLLRIVLYNLLSNAWKFTSHCDHAQIKFYEIINAHEHTYTIKDNGAGFDMKYAANLFGAFQRLHRQNEFEGTGIGLATVQRIIHRHGGKVWAEAVPNQGATFYFSIG